MSGCTCGSKEARLRPRRLAVVAAIVVIGGCSPAHVARETASSTPSAVQKGSAAPGDRVAAGTNRADLKLPVDVLTADNPVRVTAELVPPQSSPGGTVTLAVRLRIGVGWHVGAMSDQRPPGLALPTTVDLRLPAEISVEGEWLCPEPERDPEHGRVYRGEVTLQRKLRIADDARPGEIELPCIVSYQACDATSCRRPEPVELRPRLVVLKR
jgi:DsbC/DsbD-like thiol-disulfide interchange protein